MTWVKLGEERVNTDRVNRYQPALSADGTPTIGVWMDSGVYLGLRDPDGALLRALDEACFPYQEGAERRFPHWYQSDGVPAPMPC